MRIKKYSIVVVLFLLVMFAAGCSKSKNNPVAASTINLNGKWKLQYFGSDTLLVNLNISSSNNNLSGSYNAEYSTYSNYTKVDNQSTGTISGTFSSDSINITGTNAFASIVGDLGNFTFKGNKVGANYKGTVAFITVPATSLTPVTLKFSNVTLVSTN